MRRILAFLPALVLTLLFGTLAAFPGVAAAASPGDLVKLADDGNPDTTADSAVYFYGADGKRYVFPNSQTYFTWYKDFSAVKIVSPSELASLAIGGNVTYRPGTRLVKITSDPNVYAVEPGGSLRWIQSEAVAKALFGDAWAKRVDDVPDAFFFNYVSGSPLAAAVYPDGSVVKRTSDGVYFRIENRNKRKIASADVLAALRVQDAFVFTTAADLSDYPNGTDITTAEAGIIDTSQKTATALPSTPTFSVRSPPTNYVAIGGEATLLEIHLASAKAVTIKKLTVKIDATTNNPADAAVLDDDKGGLVYLNNAQPNLKAVRIIDVLGGEPFGRKDVVLDVTKDQSQTFEFVGTLAIPAGTDKVLYLRANVNDLLPAAEGYKATLIASGTSLADGLTGASMAFLPSADLVGPTLLSLNASLEVVASATVPGLKTYIRGAKDAEINGLTFKATTVAPNVIKSLIVQGFVDDEGANGFLPSQDADAGPNTRVKDLLPMVSLWTSGTGAAKIAGPVLVDVDGRATFTGLNVAIAAGQSTVLVVRGDFSSTIDVRNNPDRVAFDVNDASQDMSVVDDKGAQVNAVGKLPNGGTGATTFATIRKNGTVAWNFVGGSGAAVAGKEALLGTLSADAKYDAYSLRTFSIRRATQAASFGDIRIEYPTGVGAAVASQTKPLIGGVATFINLDIPLEKDKKTDIKVYSTVRPKDGGAVYGEPLNVSFGAADPLQFVSKTDNTFFSEANVVAGTTGDFTVPSNPNSQLFVRFSTLALAKTANNPAGILYRDNAVETLRFTATAGAEGAVRLKKLTFKITPGDVGVGGANDDALEKWAKLNGDFEEDDFMVNLQQVYGTQKTLIGEGSSGHIQYSIVRGGTKNTSPSTLTSTSGDYGLLEYDLEGSEITIGPGGTYTFAVEVDTTQFVSGKDWPLEVSLLGGNDFLWTDVPSGTYSALFGTDATGLALANSITVKL